MEFEDLHMQSKRPNYDCLLFDLDDTLYPLSSGINAAITNNIKDYMVQKLGIDETKIVELGNALYKNYGTTLAGLKGIGYDLDYNAYHSYVHGRLPYNEYLKADPVLRNLLLSLPIRKVIFTNADKVHALEVLNRLGLEDCFEGIICFETLNKSNLKNTNDIITNGSIEPKIFDILGYLSEPNPNYSVLPKTFVLCKPSDAAIEQALAIANIDPHKTLFFDDSIRNVQAGKRVGLNTVLVGSSQRVKGADYALESIHNLREAIPQLWELAAADMDMIITNSEVVNEGKISVEQPVQA